MKVTNSELEYITRETRFMVKDLNDSSLPFGMLISTTTDPNFYLNNAIVCIKQYMMSNSGITNPYLIITAIKSLVLALIFINRHAVDCTKKTNNEV